MEGEGMKIGVSRPMYFENGTKCDYSYSGRRIANRTPSIEWCHSNDTILFNVK